MSAYRICYNFCDSAFRALHLLVNQDPQEMQIDFAKHWLGKQSVALLLLVMLETSKWDPGPSQTEVSLILFSEGGGWLAKFTLDWEYWPGPVKHVTRLLFPAFPWSVCGLPSFSLQESGYMWRRTEHGGSVWESLHWRHIRGMVVTGKISNLNSKITCSFL